MSKLNISPDEFDQLSATEDFNILKEERMSAESIQHDQPDELLGEYDELKIVHHVRTL